MKSTLIDFTFTLILSLRLVAGAGEPKVGDKPPPLGLEKVLQAPSDVRANWEALRDRVVVLEFWATWCGPCIAAIPHLNEVADHFSSKPVQFIAITDEDEKVVGPFLKRKPIHTWVGLDTDKSMFKAYGIQGIPHTVVVDRKGRIAAITYPTVLTVQHIEDLLAGKKLALAEPKHGKEDGLRPGELPGSARQEKDALFQVLVRPSAEEYSRSASGQGSLSILGSEVIGILSSCYRINSVRIITNCVLPEGRFDFVVKTPAKHSDSPNNWLRQAVETTFGLTAKRESREMDVYVLTARNPNSEHLSPTVSTGGSSSSSGPGRIQAVNGTMESLAWSLENLLKKPVLDETKLTNRYDFELKWDAKEREHPDPEGLAKAVREELGLELMPATRPVEVLVVDSTKER
jgi:uncharacterized protein (TIGR03435 family)